MPGVIVVGLDESETSMRAGAYAAGMARRQGWRLVGVHVRPVAGGMLSFADPFAASIAASFANGDTLPAELHDTLQLSRFGVDCEIFTRHGDPFAQLCQVATRMWADAVIVGRSRSPLHRIAGSVAHRLVRCGRWPVTVVP
ncbi:universal stress protein [Actinoplanes sp. L3-i22]|uniref:universal stress protein n=1 Tax=Actinoplanes sp. L3-i22 TaxID=2836373 RepID=UPI001C77762F|nr:universal stress protein [Actinoplanes sp. L3-i22]BCY11661.1 universal stress protein A [Actinoplanes sp. L3-i22]